MKSLCVVLSAWIAFAATARAGAGETSWTLKRVEDRNGVEIFECPQPGKPEFHRLLAKPPGKGPFPAVVLNHGGRTGAPFLYNCLAFPENGFVAIACDLRHAEIPVDDFRNLKWEEGMGPGTSREDIRRDREEIDILKSLSFVNPNQIVMYGHSGGGHLTVGFLALGNQDRAIKAAAITSAGIYPKHPDQLRDPKNPERYRVFPQLDHVKAMSVAAEEVKNISVPLLSIHGRKDHICPLESATTLKEELDKHGKENTLIIQEEADHNDTKTSADFEEIVRFFQKHLGLPAAPRADAPRESNTTETITQAPKANDPRVNAARDKAARREARKGTAEKTRTEKKGEQPMESSRAIGGPEAAPAASRPRGAANEEARLAEPAPTFADVPYGPHESNRIDFWKSKSATPVPLVVFIHGGGFRGGDKSKHDSPLLEACLKSGISYASINYRLSGVAPYPAQMRDSARAIQFIRSKAAEWNIDPKRLACTGGSAGAGISLWLAFHDDLADPKSADPVERQSTRLSCALPTQAQCTYDPREIKKIVPGNAYDVAPLKLLQGLPETFNWDKDPIDADLDARLRDVSPITHLTRDDPPVWVMHSAAADVPGNIHNANFGRHLKKAMDALGIECIHKMNTDFAAPQERVDAMMAFLKRHFGMK